MTHSNLFDKIKRKKGEKSNNNNPMARVAY
jgi:hypothetical protein